MGTFATAIVNRQSRLAPASFGLEFLRHINIAMRKEYFTLLSMGDLEVVADLTPTLIPDWRKLSVMFSSYLAFWQGLSIRQTFLGKRFCYM